VIFSENLMPRYGNTIKNFFQKRVEKVDFQIIKNRYTFLPKKHIHLYIIDAYEKIFIVHTSCTSLLSKFLLDQEVHNVCV
jgi:hypothetical protein